MSYNPNIDSGMAPRTSWMHMPSADFAGIPQGPDSQDPRTRNYAQLVYQINSPPTVISGDVVVDSVGLDGTGTVKLSGDQLKVFDQGVIAALADVSLNIKSAYSTLVRVSGDFTYVMKAEPGNLSGDGVWQVKRVRSVGSSIDVEWADGDSEFDNVAADYLSLPYSL